MAHDAIIVTVDYRLNIFGFMNFVSIDSDFEEKAITQSGHLIFYNALEESAQIAEMFMELSE